MVLVITIVDRNLTGFLVDNVNSWIILQTLDMNIYCGGDLFSINDSLTHPCKATYLKLSLAEQVRGRKVTVNSLLILCRSTFKGILGRSFLENLDVMASPIHL